VLSRRGRTPKRAFQIWDEWSRTCAAKYDEADQRKTWESFGRRQGERAIALATIYHIAKEYGWAGETSPQKAEIQPSVECAPARHFAGTPAVSSVASSQSGAIDSAKLASTRDTMISAADLRLMTFEPVRYVVPRFVPEGVTLLVGRPKIGKSLLALEQATA
jgi:hypothetical protein